MGGLKGAEVEKPIECGRIGRAVGLRGELAVFWMSGDAPVAPGDEIIVEGREGSQNRPMCVAALRKQGRSFVIRLEGVADRAAAEALTGSRLFLEPAKLERLPEGTYYCRQIVGLEVVTEEGKSLGRVANVFTAGENDVYEVRPAGGKPGSEILIPAVDHIVLKIDLKAGRITVRPLDGMLE